MEPCPQGNARNGKKARDVRWVKKGKKEKWKEGKVVHAKTANFEKFFSADPEIIWKGEGKRSKGGSRG